MTFSLTEPAQLHRHTFGANGGAPHPPIAEGAFWKCVRAWRELPCHEQPFYFLSLEDRGDFGFDQLVRLSDHRTPARQ
jgi:hypothetical protein